MQNFNEIKKDKVSLLFIPGEVKWISYTCDEIKMFWQEQIHTSF